jgi:hypothetical protein
MGDIRSSSANGDRYESGMPLMKRDGQRSGLGMEFPPNLRLELPHRLDIAL